MYFTAPATPRRGGLLHDLHARERTKCVGFVPDAPSLLAKWVRQVAYHADWTRQCTGGEVMPPDADDIEGAWANERTMVRPGRTLRCCTVKQDEAVAAFRDARSEFK